MSFRMPGQRVRESTGTRNKKLAERIHAKRLTEISERMFDLKATSRTNVTFGELADRYEREYVPRLQDEARAKGILVHLRTFFGNKTPINAIGDKVGAYAEHRSEAERPPSPATVVKELGVLRRMFNVARKRWRIQIDNPVDLVEMPKVRNERVRYLNPGEMQKLTVALPSWLRPIVTLARQTGLRRGDLLGLTWNDVDLDKRVPHVIQKKTGRAVAIPLTETAGGILAKQGRVRHLTSPYVFTNRNGEPFEGMSVGKVFERACNKAGIENLRFHDLRHDFASCLVQAGVNLNVVRELLGHKDTRTTLRYAHLAPENLREAVKVLDENKNGHDLVTVNES